MEYNIKGKGLIAKIVDFFFNMSYYNDTKIGDSLPKTLKWETIKIGDQPPKTLKR